MDYYFLITSFDEGFGEGVDLKGALEIVVVKEREGLK